MPFLTEKISINPITSILQLGFQFGKKAYLSSKTKEDVKGEWIPVSSSFIEEIKYVEESNEILIRFSNGTISSYTGSERLFRAFLEAPSKGKFYWEAFRNGK